jgi:hypothetical protein
MDTASLTFDDYKTLRGVFKLRSILLSFIFLDIVVSFINIINSYYYIFTTILIIISFTGIFSHSISISCIYVSYLLISIVGRFLLVCFYYYKIFFLISNLIALVLNIIILIILIKHFEHLIKLEEKHLIILLVLNWTPLTVNQRPIRRPLRRSTYSTFD